MDGRKGEEGREGGREREEKGVREREGERGRERGREGRKNKEMTEKEVTNMPITPIYTATKTGEWELNMWTYIVTGGV